jgi:hypothetical protein
MQLTTPVVLRWGLAPPLVAIVALAALSLLVLPAAPANDAFSWLIWGRELSGGRLETEGGASWKPPTVLIAVPLAALGEAAPDAWTLIARVGQVAAVVLALRLAARGGGLLGGVLAALTVGLAPWLWLNGGEALSEGLAAAALLLALDRHLDGRHGQAFGLAAAVALTRPELGPVLALYGLGLVSTSAGRVVWVAPSVVVVAALWVVPELVGSGQPLRAATRAQEGAAGTVEEGVPPALDALRLAFEMLPAAVWPLALVAVATAVLGGVAARTRATVLVPAAVAGGWLLLSAVLADAGVAIVERLLIPPAVLCAVVVGQGGGVAVRWLVSSQVPLGSLLVGALDGVPERQVLARGPEWEIEAACRR